MIAVLPINYECKTKIYGTKTKFLKSPGENELHSKEINSKIDILQRDKKNEKVKKILGISGRFCSLCFNLSFYLSILVHFTYKETAKKFFKSGIHINVSPIS